MKLILKYKIFYYYKSMDKLVKKKYSKKVKSKIKSKKSLKKKSGSKYASKTKKIPNKRPFLFNPNNRKKSFDVYIDKDPSDTIKIKYTTPEDVENTITKLEKLYKADKYSHKRIWQVGMILKVRLGVIKKYHKTRYPNAEFVNQRYKLAEKYFSFLSQRSKVKNEDERKKLVFTF